MFVKTQRQHSLKSRIIPGVILLVGVTFALTVGAELVMQTLRDRENLQQTLSMLANEKAAELENCFMVVENAVDTAEKFIVRTIDEERILQDAGYEQSYMALVADQMATSTGLPKSVATLYFRMEVERFGGTRGFFMSGSRKTGFIAVKPTDIKRYSPTDSEHVGWYYIPVWKKAPVWTAPYLNKNINVQMISYIVPVYKADTLLGVVGMDIKLAAIKSIIETTSIEDALIMLLGTEGNLVHCNKTYESKSTVEQTADISGMCDRFQLVPDGATQKFNWNNEPHTGMLRKLENGMTLVAAVPAAAIARGLLPQVLILCGILVVILIITWGAIGIGIERFIQPIREMSVATFKLSRGEMQTRVYYQSNNELGQLADNIRKMTVQIKEYIAYVREQTKQERRAKERAQAESQSKSEFLSSMYLSMHEIDLASDTLKLVQSRNNADSSPETVRNANEVLHQLMQKTADKRSWDTLLPFVNLLTLQKRMGKRITIAQEFEGTGGIWCRGRFIAMDKNSDGSLHHVLWAVENINEERAERERLQDEVAKSVAASEAKSAFLANMSHEIRTPINAVLGMDEMILRECDDSDIRKYATSIKAAGATLLAIINNILDFSKIEAGKMELIPENYDMSPLIVDLINMISDRVKKKNLAFVLNVNAALPNTLYGDSMRIKQCVLNLLTNAVKYTQRGTITFTVDFTKTDDSHISLHVGVEDTGVGIKSEDMERLFSPFERIEEDRNKTVEGTGLGLSIVKTILAMMGTKLDVKSEYGKGSLFSFDVEQQVVDWKAVGDIQEAHRQSINAMSVYKERLHAPAARILVVDDTEINHEVIQGLLKKTGITIDTAAGGREALEKVREHEYDILFIDHRMPEMDGIQTLHAMHHMTDNKSAGKPCIALTANVIAGVRQMYLSEGFTDYLSKPVNPDTLEDMIRKYLPAEKIEAGSGTPLQDAKSGEQNQTALLEKLRGVDGLDANAALKNCGSVELLQSMLSKFCSSIDGKASELQSFFDESDWKNYYIKVHALKSTSRLVGALALAASSEHLEYASRDEQIAELKEKHPLLMEQCRNIKNSLAPVVEEQESSVAENSRTDKVAISEAAFVQKLAKFRALTDDLNINGLDALVAELSKVRLPEKYTALFEKIRLSVENVDYNGLKTVLNEA